MERSEVFGSLLAQIKITRIPLGELPSWAQDKLVSTALGLLEDENAFAVSDAGSFRIYAHGFRYTVAKHVPFVY